MDKRKIILFSDADDLQGKLLEKEIEKFFSEDEVKVFNCKESRIEYCIGCYTCFYRTPGKCIYSDDMDGILGFMANSDIIFILSRIKFGCYSPNVKKALDRIIPLERPFIRTVNGETHFEPRYPKRKLLLAAGYGGYIEVDDALLFTDLVQRNSINLNADFREPIFFSEADSAEKKLSGMYGDLI